MPTLLSDPPIEVYAILVLGILISCAVWFNQRNGKSLAVFGCFLAIFVLVFVIDRLFESPREEAVRHVEDMARAIDARDVEGFIGHVADTLRYEGEDGPRTVLRDELRRSPLWSALQQFGVNHVAAWDFARSDVAEIDENTIEIGFLGKAEAAGKQAPMYFRARFSRQADGHWKLSGLSSYDPMKRVNERKGIPNFP